MNIRIVIMTLATAVAAGPVWVKLPPGPAADPAKAAAEAKKKADGEKKEKEMLVKAEDRAVANYRKNKGAKK